jgi:hypothetical protein
MREDYQIFSCLVTWLSSDYGTKVATLDAGLVVFRGD